VGSCNLPEVGWIQKEFEDPLFGSFLLRMVATTHLLDKVRKKSPGWEFDLVPF
jgi:hypothetical protein